MPRPRIVIALLAASIGAVPANAAYADRPVRFIV